MSLFVWLQVELIIKTDTANSRLSGSFAEDKNFFQI